MCFNYPPREDRWANLQGRTMEWWHQRTPDWSESGWDLPEWIWMTRFHFLLFPDDSGICSEWVDTEGTAHFWIFQKHSDIEKHRISEWSVSRFCLTTLLMTIAGWIEVPPGRTPGPVPHRCPLGLHFLLVTWGGLSEWLLRSLLILTAGKSNKWFVFLNKTKQKWPTNSVWGKITD